MTNTIFTATGCTRCKIARRFMDELGIVYQEKDMKGDGKEDFRKFYAANRGAIFRGKEGVEFPILFDGAEIRQGVGVVVAYLQAGRKLDGFFGHGELTKAWIDGLHVSGGDPALGDTFLLVLKYLKKNGLKLQLDTHGKNASLLEQVLELGLGDRVIMDVKGPLSLYDQILGDEIDPAEIEKTMALVTRFPEYGFQTTVAPVPRRQGKESEISYLTPDEIGQTAGLITEATGDRRHPYLLRLFRPDECPDERFRLLKTLTHNDLFRYRSAARQYQVYTEIEKK